jgi:hypothetical protein
MIQNVVQDPMARASDLAGLTLEADGIPSRVPGEKRQHSPRGFVSCGRLKVLS